MIQKSIFYGDSVPAHLGAMRCTEISRSGGFHYIRFNLPTGGEASRVVTTSTFNKLQRCTQLGSHGQAIEDKGACQ